MLTTSSGCVVHPAAFDKISLRLTEAQKMLWSRWVTSEHVCVFLHQSAWTNSLFQPSVNRDAVLRESLVWTGPLCSIWRSSPSKVLQGGWAARWTVYLVEYSAYHSFWGPMFSKAVVILIIKDQSSRNAVSTTVTKDLCSRTQWLPELIGTVLVIL